MRDSGDAERMRAAGYKTGLMGKCHLGGQKEYDPLSRGFDEYSGFGNGAIYITTPKPGDENDCVGALLAKLDEHKLTGNTFVAFLSDNGCPPYLPAGTCSNGPFSGFKRYQLEGGIRVPMILKYPGWLTAGTVYNAPVISLDLTATVLALAGADVSKPPAIEGVNLMPFLTGRAKGSPHNRFFWRAGANYAVHEGDWEIWGVEKPDGGSATFLLNLKTDPAEARNLAAGRPGMVRSNVPPGYKGRISDVEVDGVMVRLTF